MSNGTERAQTGADRPPGFTLMTVNDLSQHVERMQQVIGRLNDMGPWRLGRPTSIGASRSVRA